MLGRKHATFHPVWSEEGAVTVGNNLHTTSASKLDGFGVKTIISY